MEHNLEEIINIENAVHDGSLNPVHALYNLVDWFDVPLNTATSMISLALEN